MSTEPQWSVEDFSRSPLNRRPVENFSGFEKTTFGGHTGGFRSPQGDKTPRWRHTADVRAQRGKGDSVQFPFSSILFCPLHHLRRKARELATHHDVCAVCHINQVANVLSALDTAATQATMRLHTKARYSCSAPSERRSLPKTCSNGTRTRSQSWETRPSDQDARMPATGDDGNGLSPAFVHRLIDLTRHGLAWQTGKRGAHIMCDGMRAVICR